jgi:hypothetical protein
MTPSTESGAGNRFESGAQKHLLHSRPIIEKLVLVTLAKIQIHDFHWCCFASATPRDQLLGRIKISSQQEFGVRYDNSEAPAGAENTIYLSRQPLPVLKGKVLHHMFAEDTVERLTWER